MVVQDTKDKNLQNRVIIIYKDIQISFGIFKKKFGLVILVLLAYLINSTIVLTFIDIKYFLTYLEVALP